MSEHTPVIVGAVRTPTGKFLGNLSSFTAPQLGAIVIKEVVQRSGISHESIDEVIMGNVVSAGIGQAPARQAAIHSGLPVDIRSEEHTSELQSPVHLVCRLLLEKQNISYGSCVPYTT